MRTVLAVGLGVGLAFALLALHGVTAFAGDAGTVTFPPPAPCPPPPPPPSRLGASVPAKSVPAESVPVESVPAESVPVESVPAEPVLVDTSVATRTLNAAVDAYLGDAAAEGNLVAGPGCVPPGSAGYDQGFWVQGGDFSLRINMTLQARYEAWVWDDDAKPDLVPRRGGSLSGFSLPRATLKFSGTAPCSISYYLELEFGHFGRDRADEFFGPVIADPLGPLVQSGNFDTLREGWIQWTSSDSFGIRMGQIRTATTRQAMVEPEMQQFVDVSLATAFMGWTMPGYTDRNRDHGVALHGLFGCKNEWSYLLAVTNGDGGDSIRNVIDVRTSDNLAYSARLNWAFLNPIGYQEGALRQRTCRWSGEAGAWAYYYADRVDRSHATVSDTWRAGIDLALGYSGWSLSAAYNRGSDESATGAEVNYMTWLVQLGYHFPGTAWEVALRCDGYENDQGVPSTGRGPQQLPFPVDGTVSEYAFGVNYYLNGHGNKLQVDVSFVQGQDFGSALIFDPYTGYPSQGQATTGDDGYGMLVRFQWTLAL